MLKKGSIHRINQNLVEQFVKFRLLASVSFAKASKLILRRHIASAVCFSFSSRFFFRNFAVQQYQMAKNKTTENENSVTDYLDSITDTKRRADSTAIIKILEEETGLPPKMWGPGIVGFGSYHYQYDSGHEGDAPLAGMACRANAIVVYFSSEFENREELLRQLGKYKSSKVCVYIKKIEDIDTTVLRKMIVNSVAHVKREYAVK